MRAGELRHRLIIEAASEASDGMGGVTTTWATFKTVWGAIWPIKGAEFTSMMQTASEITTKIRIRYLAGLTAKHRIKWIVGSSTTYYDIEEMIDADKRNIFYDLMCKETVPVKDG